MQLKDMEKEESKQSSPSYTPPTIMNTKQPILQSHAPQYPDIPPPVQMATRVPQPNRHPRNRAATRPFIPVSAVASIPNYMRRRSYPAHPHYAQRSSYERAPPHPSLVQRYPSYNASRSSIVSTPSHPYRHHHQQQIQQQMRFPRNQNMFRPSPSVSVHNGLMQNVQGSDRNNPINSNNFNNDSNNNNDNNMGSRIPSQSIPSQSVAPQPVVPQPTTSQSQSIPSQPMTSIVSVDTNCDSNSNTNTVGNDTANLKTNTNPNTNPNSNPNSNHSSNATSDTDTNEISITATNDTDKTLSIVDGTEDAKSQVESTDFDESDNHGNVALLMHEKWLKRILYYGKSWEIRGRNTRIRGKIYLAFKNHIYGETHIIDCFPITNEELKQNFNLHHVEDLSIVKYKTPHIWMLDNTKRYNKPIKFPRKKGQIVFCSVNMNNLRGNEIFANENEANLQTVHNANDKGKIRKKRKYTKRSSSKSLHSKVDGKKVTKRRKIVKSKTKTKSKATAKTKKKGKKTKKVSKAKKALKGKKSSTGKKAPRSKKANKVPKAGKGAYRFTDPEDGALTEPKPNLFNAMTDEQWSELIDTDAFACCNKKVGGSAVMCDECDGEWHEYCLRWTYHIRENEIKRIQTEGESFVCIDCRRAKMGKIRRI